MANRQTLLIAAFLALAGTAHAVQIEALASSDWDTKAQGYQGVGAGVLRPVNDRWTAFGRLSASRVRYTFDSGAANLTGDILAVSPTVGVRYRAGSLNLGLSTGVDFRRTRRTTVSDGFENSDQTGVSAQTELDWWFARFYDLSVLSSFSSVDSFFWARGRLKRQITNLNYTRPASWFVGVESSGSGNSDFNSYQFGGVVECVYRPWDLSTAIKGGYKNSTGYHDIGYAGVELYYRR